MCMTAAVTSASASESSAHLNLRLQPNSPGACSSPCISQSSPKLWANCDLSRLYSMATLCTPLQYTFLSLFLSFSFFFSRSPLLCPAVAFVVTDRKPDVGDVSRVLFLLSLSLSLSLSFSYSLYSLTHSLSLFLCTHTFFSSLPFCEWLSARERMEREKEKEEKKRERNFVTQRADIQCSVEA